MLNDARVEHDSLHRAIAEAVIILTEDLPVRHQAFGRRNIADIVIPCNGVKRNTRIKFMRDTQILFDLCFVPRFVHQISAHDNKSREKAVRGRDSELKVSALLGEACIWGIHAELWVRHLKKEQILRTGGPWNR